MSGITYYTYFLAEALSAKCQVSVILMRRLIPRWLYPGRHRVETKITGLSTREFAPTFDGIDWYGLPTILLAMRFLHRNRPSHIIFQWWTGAVLPWYLVIALVSRLYGCRLILELHEVEDAGEARVPFVEPIVSRGLRLLTDRADLYIVHSEDDAVQFARALGLRRDRVHVIFHGPYPLAGRRRGAELGRSSDEPSVILFFGTIRPYKGLEYLVEAFDELCSEQPEKWQLVVVGETWEGWTKPVELIRSSPNSECIRFVNRYVQDAELPDFFNDATVVALPYLRSSASGPLHMAMSHGLPVVVTAVGGLTSVAAQYEGTVLVRPADVSSLKQGLQTAIGLSPPFDDPFSWSLSASSILDVLARPLSASRPDSSS